MDKDPLRRAARAPRTALLCRRLRTRGAIACGLLVAAIGTTILAPPRPRLLWNASASAPIGLWRVMPGVPIDRGDMVVARLAQPWRGLAAQRHYLPANVPLVKRVAAVSGDEVCAIDAMVLVNGRYVASRRDADGAGRRMPSWHGCKVLRGGAALLLMDDPASFDGRYFGPTERADIIGKAAPIWLR